MRLTIVVISVITLIPLGVTLLIGYGGPAASRRRLSVLQLKSIIDSIRIPLDELCTCDIWQLAAHRLTLTHDYPRSSWGVFTGKVLAHADDLAMIVDYIDWSASALRLLLVKILTDHRFIDHKCLNGHRMDCVPANVAIVTLLVSYRDSYEAVAHWMPL